MTNKVDTSLWDIEAKQHSKRVYFNKPQLLTQYNGAKTTVIVAGRRTGKTDSIASPFVLRNMQRMPGSTGGIVVPTFKHGLTNTLPGLLAAWKRWGYINGVHYVVGRKPPKSFSLSPNRLTMSMSSRSIMARWRSSSVRTAQALPTRSRFHGFSLTRRSSLITTN